MCSGPARRAKTVTPPVGRSNRRRLRQAQSSSLFLPRAGWQRYATYQNDPRVLRIKHGVPGIPCGRPKVSLSLGRNCSGAKDRSFVTTRGDLRSQPVARSGDLAISVAVNALRKQAARRSRCGTSVGGRRDPHTSTHFPGLGTGEFPCASGSTGAGPPNFN